MKNVGLLRRRGLGAAGALMSLALILAGCTTGGPAPVVNGDQGPPPPTQIIVQRGQTLSGIAHAYHVPMAVLAETNRLAPPYRILVGQALIIPVGAAPNTYGPMVATAQPSPSTSVSQPPIAPLSPPVPLSPPAPASAEPPPLGRTPPAGSAKPPKVAESPIASTPPRTAASAATVPTPFKPVVPASPPSQQEQPSGLPTAPGPTASAGAPPPPARGGTFLWPVRGHVLEGFGAGPDGTHNDGINIAAPRGAAIEATEGGVVAYTGNELRGYGNLILIKHPGGWISAYAHCDLMLVKTGQKVARGQVIARVGATGNVSGPQLHFELRRGKKPIDPREYLTPLSTAAAKEGRPS
jgi:murein DD-endopeptidase MepM/ murein hydrolase activator NlpD